MSRANMAAPLRWAFCRRVLVLAVLAVAPFCAGAAVRVALLDLICEDNSYRSTVAAADFTAVLQAAVANDSAFEWVERVELGKAEAELRLGHFGLIDRAEAIRGGHWVNADWAVLGRISTNAPTGRTLRLEVVDLRCADVLAVEELVLTSRDAHHFRLASSEVAEATTTLRSALDAAARHDRQNRERPSVALLFLAQPAVSRSFAGSPSTPRRVDWEEELRQGIRRAATNTGRFHLVQLRRAGAAMDEANLVLTGLAESATNAWERVADQYVWGACDTSHKKSYDPRTRQWLEETGVRVSLTLWDASTEPRTVVVSLTNATTMEEVLGKVMAELEPRLGRASPSPAAEGTRNRVAESLAAYAVELAQARGGGWLGSAEGLRQWLELVRVLEAACFFNPGNQTAREWWARARWGRPAQQAAGNEFFFARRRGEAWRKHVEQFGFQSVGPPVRRGWWETNSVAAEYLLSAWRPFEMFRFSQYDQARWGVPRDAGGPELRAWQREFAREFYARLLAAPDLDAVSAWSWDFFYGALILHGEAFVLSEAKERARVLERLWPRVLEQQRARAAPFDRAYLRGLSLHFRQLNRPGGERAWLDELEQIASTQREKERTAPVQLPRASDLDGPP